MYTPQKIKKKHKMCKNRIKNEFKTGFGGKCSKNKFLLKIS